MSRKPTLPPHPTQSDIARVVKTAMDKKRTQEENAPRKIIGYDDDGDTPDSPPTKYPKKTSDEIC